MIKFSEIKDIHPKGSIWIGENRNKNDKTLLHSQALSFHENFLDVAKDVFTEDKYYKKILNRKIRTYGMSKRIIFKGRLEEEYLSEKYRTSDILIVPSLYEGYGMVVREGMSFGLPIVASNVGGIPEQINDGIEGFLVQPGDSKVLAEALRKLIMDPGLRKQMGKKSYKRATELPTWDNVCERFYQAVEEFSQ